MSQVLDYLIIGAGPGGLQLGFFLERAKRNYLILERGDAPGVYFRDYPRHRKLLSINKVFTGSDDPVLNLRWDWNSLIGSEDAPRFKDYSQRYFPDADDLVRYLEDYAKHHRLKIATETTVTLIDKQDDLFVVATTKGTFRARAVIVATGVPRLNLPDIPGLEHMETYAEMDLDPMAFANQRVLIVGKGNSAFETADALIETAAAIHLTSPDFLKLAWKSHHVGHLRAVNNNFLDTYLLKAQNGIFDAHIEQVERRDDGRLQVRFKLARADGPYAEDVYDRILLCSGFRCDDSIFADGCKPELALGGRFPAQKADWESTNVANLFFAGTLMQARDFKKTQSSFIHGFRYNIQSLFHMLEMRFYGTSWPATKLATQAKDLGDQIVERINRGTALWHQTGFLCDVLALNGDGSAYYRQLPSDYVREGGASWLDDYVMVTLEYGPDDPDFPFEFKRFTDPADAHRNPQLHPILRHYRKGQLVGEHHVMEEIEGRWVDPCFTTPIYEFLERCLEPAEQEIAT